MQAPLEIESTDGSTAIRLPGPYDAVGWTLLGGGLRTVSAITWSFASLTELGPDVDADAWLRDRVRGMGCDPGRTAAFITSRSLDSRVSCSTASDLGVVTAIATVGLGNALRVGDPAEGGDWCPGTINIALILPVCASCSALLEALGLVQEAKAAALLGGGVLSTVSGEFATGTGTDAAVVAAPRRPFGIGGDPVRFVGKHTSIGSAIGRAVLDVVNRGAMAWARERRAAARVVLVGGGARSGKSAFAERRALEFPGEREGSRPVYIATGQPFDGEMEDRIRRHKQQRGDLFETVEEPIELVAALLEAADRRPSAILVDCLTLWLSNLLCRDVDDEEIAGRCARLVECVRALNVPVVLVSNEVGLGLVPESAVGRRFRDATGRLHQGLSEASDEVYLAALGTVLRIKPGPVLPVDRLACAPPVRDES